MRTEVAFGCSVGTGIDIERIVRAGLHAALASNTASIVEVYDSIRTAEEGVGGANLYAGSIVTVVTSHHAEMTAGVREFTFLDVLDPGAEYPHWNLMLLFARHRTGVTADTSVLIDDESVAHKKLSIVT